MANYRGDRIVLRNKTITKLNYKRYKFWRIFRGDVEVKETFINTLNKLLELKKIYEEVDGFIKEKCPNKDFVTSYTLSVFLDDYVDLVVDALAMPFKQEEEVKDFISYLVYEIHGNEEKYSSPNVWVGKNEYIVKDAESLWEFISQNYKLKKKL